MIYKIHTKLPLDTVKIQLVDKAKKLVSVSWEPMNLKRY